MNALRLFDRTRIEATAAAGLEVVLQANHPLRLANARGRRLRCTSGCAWVTAPGLRDDIFLRVGQDWQVVTDGLVLVEAVGSATVALGTAARTPWRRR